MKKLKHAFAAMFLLVLTMGCQQNSANEIPLKGEQLIILEAGWNMLSSYLKTADSIQLIIENILPKVQLIEDSDGKQYQPGQPKSTLSHMQFGKGYKIKVSEACTLHIKGIQIDPATYPILLPKGTSFLAYLKQEPSLLKTELAAIIPNMHAIVDEHGLAYWPEHGIDQFDVLQPGKAYVLHMNQESILVYNTDEE